MKQKNQETISGEEAEFCPTDEIAGYRVRPGMFEANGSTALSFGVNFTISTHNGTGVELLLFHPGEEEPFAVLPFPESYRIGDVYSMIVFDLDINSFEYAYRVDGPYAPERGLLFDRKNVILDPYAKAVTGQEIWGAKRSGSYHARVVEDGFDWGNVRQSDREMSDLIIYELHVRGFTEDASSGVKKRGTFEGLREKIPYLKELGINAVEMMPIFEFDEMLAPRTYQGKTLIDYWGYNTVSFFAPDSAYMSQQNRVSRENELKSLIRELHENGIEVILDVVFNHTAEGNERGTVISFKGLDNRVYYMMTPEANYYNFSGCGNTLNCNHPVVRQMILECLRYWTINYRVDGFRFDLASILGRSEDGSPLNKPPLLEILAYDPVLRNVKLIAEAWDAGGIYQVGSFPASGRWAEWNGRYRDSLRSFLKGWNWEAVNAANSMAGSMDLYGRETGEGARYAGYNSCINFLTCHDGFTLYDLYSYNEKHNEMNGWNNADGSNDNRSWNCGAEGETDDPEVMALRMRMIRNAAAVLMCSRGTPMFLAGDEFCNTQQGNNNCYCQDNEISWLNWNLLEKNRETFDFFRYMIRFRKEHPAIRRRMPNAVCGFAPVAFYDAACEGKGLEGNPHAFGISFAGYDREKCADDLVYIAVNSYWEPVPFALPKLNNAGVWFLQVCTWPDEKGNMIFPEGQLQKDGEFVLMPRSVAVFVGRSF